MKKEYEHLQIELMIFSNDDVLMISNFGDHDNIGDDPFDWI